MAVVGASGQIQEVLLPIVGPVEWVVHGSERRFCECFRSHGEEQQNVVLLLHEMLPEEVNL
jgi:hypothetical protein